MQNHTIVALTVILVIILGVIALVTFAPDFSSAPESQTATPDGTVAPSAATENGSAETAPQAATAYATDVTASRAVLHGTINPNGATTTYWFEYSADPLMGAVLIRSTPEIALAARTGAAPVEAEVTGLIESTTYYFRLVARNNKGLVRGERMSFITRVTP
jgi:hypothetical protein